LYYLHDVNVYYQNDNKNIQQSMAKTTTREMSIHLLCYEKIRYAEAVKAGPIPLSPDYFVVPVPRPPPKLDSSEIRLWIIMPLDKSWRKTNFSSTLPRSSV
jgi:hypothetical protein